MNKFLVLFVTFLLVTMPLFGQEQVRAGHDEFLKYLGHKELTTGQHYVVYSFNLDGNQKNTLETSVYIMGNDFSFYMEGSREKANTFVSTSKTEENVTLDITHNIKRDDAVHTLKYQIVFDVKTQNGFHVEMDQPASDIKIDWQKVISCVFKLAPEIYPQVMKCLQEPNVGNCILNLIQPLTELYRCIFQQNLESVQLPRSIKEVVKSWSLSRDTTATYIEIGSLNVIDKRVKIERWSSNILYLQVTADMIGNGVVKVYLVKAQWAGTGSWSASGIVTLICQN